LESFSASAEDSSFGFGVLNVDKNEFSFLIDAVWLFWVKEIKKEFLDVFRIADDADVFLGELFYFS